VKPAELFAVVRFELTFLSHRYAPDAFDVLQDAETVQVLAPDAMMQLEGTVSAPAGAPATDIAADMVAFGPTPLPQVSVYVVEIVRLPVLLLPLEYGEAAPSP
jgi:hypothetical protein